MINEQKKKDNTLLQVDETIEKIESTNNTENLAIKMRKSSDCIKNTKVR